MVQSVKRACCTNMKIPSTYEKARHTQWNMPAIPALGTETSKWLLGARWPAGLARFASSGFNERLSRKRGGEIIEEDI